MPTYVFSCQSCGTGFEEKRSFAQAGDPATCPDCGSGRTKKLLNAVAVHTSGREPSSQPRYELPVNGGGCGCGGGCSCRP